MPLDGTRCVADWNPRYRTDFDAAQVAAAVEAFRC